MDSLYNIYTQDGSLPWIITAVIYVFYVICYWRIYRRAGQPGWAAIVPVYNLWVLFKVAGMSPWWILGYLLGFIPVIGPIAVAVIGIVTMVNLSPRFGHGLLFSLGLIFLGFIFIPILAFSNNRYIAASEGY